MPEATSERRKLLVRVRRIGGLVDALDLALQGDDTSQVLHLITGVHGATIKLMALVFEDHIRNHLIDTETYPKAFDANSVEQLIQVVPAYLR